MRSRIVRQIYKKEFIEIIRDRKNVFMTFILPIMLYPLISILAFQVISMSNSSIIGNDINIVVSSDVNDDFINYLKSNSSAESVNEVEIGKLKISDKKVAEKNIDAIKKMIDKKNVDAYISFDKKNGRYTIYFNSTDPHGENVKKRIDNVIKTYKQKLVENNIRSMDKDPDKVLNPVIYEFANTSDENEQVGNFIGSMLPFILIIGVLTGTIYPAIDVITGEKERGTLETLFTLPITNAELITGKYLAVCTISVVNALLNIFSMGLTFSYFALMIGKMGKGNINISFDYGGMIIPMVIAIFSIIVFAMVISVIATCVCSFAKSYKEAQNYLTPLTIITIIPAYASLVPTFELNKFTAFIPVVNISLLIKSVFLMKYSLALMLVVLIVNMIFVTIGILALSKIFNSEDMLFGGHGGISLLVSRKNIKKGGKPTIADGILMFFVQLLILITAGSYLQTNYGNTGLILSQLIMVLVVLIYCWYIKVDIKKYFKFRKIGFSDILYTFAMWILATVLVFIVSSLTIKLFPNAEEISKAMGKMITDNNVIVSVLIVALTPAICEEFLFRGFIMSAFSNEDSFSEQKFKNEENSTTGKTYCESGDEKYLKKKRRAKKYRKLSKNDIFAAVFSGILFGCMHIYLFKILPISILGIILGILVKKTDSIYSSMFAHFINNLFAVIVTFISSGIAMMFIR